MAEQTYSTSLPKAEPKTYDIGVDTGAPLTGNALDGRTFKYHIALGASSPGFDEIKRNLSAGQEDQYQKMLQDQEMASRAATGRDLVNTTIQQGVEADPNLVAALADPGQPPNKSTVVEEQYYKKAMDYISSQETTEAMMKAIDEDPMGLGEKYRPYEEIGVKNHITQKWAAKVDQMVQNTGYLPYAGYWVMQASQVPTWANVIGNWRGGPKSSSWTTGGALEEKVAAIRAMDPVSMDKAIEAEVTALATVNPLDAQKFVEALKSFGANDLAMNYVDDISMIPVGTAAKLGKEGVKVAKAFKNESKALAEATEAGAKQAATPVAEGAGKAATDVPKAAEGLKDPVAKEVEDTARAAAAEGTDIPTALSGSGKPKAASDWEIRRNIAESQLPEAPGALQRNWARATRKLNSWANTKLKTNAGDNFYTARANDMEPLVERFLKIVADTTDVARVSRIPREAAEKAFELAEKTYLEQYNRIQDRILDIASIPSTERILPGQTGLNVGMIKFNFGKEGGQLFDSVEGAEQAIRVYGLPRQDTVIKQSGSGYYLESYSTVGEDRVVDMILTPENLPQKNTWSVMRNWIGGSKGQTSKFQSMQRAAVVHSETHLGALIREVYAPYEKLGKRSRKALDQVMRRNQLEERIPGDPNTRGMYYQTGPELEKAYMDELGRIPTADESNAYFAVVRAADLDWMYRSWSQYRLKATQGFQNVTVSRLVKDGQWGKNTFEGRVIDRKDFPIDSKHNIDVLYIGEDGMVAKINLAKATDAEKEVLRHAQAENWKIVQPYQVRDPKLFKVSGDTDPIAYVISKDVDKSNLRLDNQVNYRPGFHNEYKSEFFVKQAKVKNGRHEGDIAALGFRTQAEATKYGTRMEQARLLLKDGKLDELKVYLQKNLPMDLKTFQKMFDEHLDVYQPMAVTRTGERTTKQGFLNGNSFANQYGVVDTTLDDLYNPSNQGFGDPFIAQRDPVLWSVSNGGTEDAPLYSLNQAELLSPMLTQTKAMGKLIKSELYNDYQISSAQHWVETFADRLSDGSSMLTREQLRRNPMYYLTNAKIVGEPNQVAQAEQLRTSIKNLVGTPSDTAKPLDMYKQKVLSGIYNRWGEKYLPAAITMSEKLIPSIHDPVSHLRALAFHSKLGLYNPVQFFVQSAALTNVVAINPVEGAQSIPAMLGARMLRLTEDDGVIRKVAEHVASLGGWSKEQFYDSYTLMRKTGFDTIGSESAWRNDVGDPTLYRSKAGRAFLDKGAFFFNEGERAVRVSAWNTAYLEYAKKNPKKVGKFDEYDVGEIRNRAQMLSGNMSRDANSWWQNHPVTSVTTQFWSYNVRMGELMIGHQLTDGERYRLMFSQGMLWGVTPAALAMYAVEQGDATPLANALNPYAEDLQSYAIKAGVNMDGTMADAAYYGMVSKWVELLSGNKYDFGSRYGMSSPQVLQTLERTLKEDGAATAVFVAAMGPSGSVVNDIFKESSNVFSSLHELYTGEGAQGATTMNDMANALRSVSTANFAHRVSAAAFGAAYRTRSGAVMASGEDPLHDAMSAILGVEDSSITEGFSLAEAGKAEEERIKDVQKYAMRYSGQIWDAWQRGDYEEADRIRKMLGPYLIARGLTPEQTLTLIYPTWERNQQLDQVILMDQIKKAKGSTRDNLVKEYQERNGN